MPRRTFDELKNWAGGAVTSTAPDLLAAGAFPRGRNTLLTQLGEGSALVGSRLGPLTLTTARVTGSPALWGFQFNQTSGASTNLVVSSTGRLDKLNADGSTTVIHATALTSGGHRPVFAAANDLCFIFTDVDQKKTDGSTVSAIGLTRPAAPAAAPTTGGSAAIGAWDVAITYVNSATGHESSRSDFSSVVLSTGLQQITLSWPAPADPQVTHVKVYVRRQELGSGTYLAAAGATPAMAANGFPIATLGCVLDISASQYADLVILAPSTLENEPPAAGLKGPCWHGSRLFLHDTGHVCYSKIKNNTPYPEAFDPSAVQPVNPDDGDEIIGLKSYRGRLLIFKRFSLWALTGYDPTSWSVDLVAAVGAASIQSVVEAPDGALYWWANSALGLMAWDGSGLPVALGQRFLADTVAPTRLAFPAFAGICAAVDEASSTVLFAVPELGGTRNTVIIPFNYQLRRFHAEWWDPLDVNSLWQVQTVDETKAVYMGGYAGEVFHWAASRNDGVATGTRTGTVTASTSTTLTDSTATFAADLAERYVYVLNQDRSVVQRRRITTNTSTQLTVATAWETDPNTSFTYVIGGIDFSLDTPWMNGASVFIKKRFEFLFTEAQTDDRSVRLDVDLFTSKNSADPRRTLEVIVGGTGGVYDEDDALYDVSTYADTGVKFGKARCACTGVAWRARVRQVLASQTVTLSKIGMQSVPMSIKH